MEPQEFVNLCERYNVKIERIHKTSGLITLTKAFTPGDNAGYVEAESSVSMIYDIPQSQPGSIWGTDGGSIGGYCGLSRGLMRLNRSGCSKRWLTKVEKLM